MSPRDERRQNRALHRLLRERLRRTQLWSVGAGDQALDALLSSGAIAVEPNPWRVCGATRHNDLFSITPVGERLLVARGWGPTY